MDHTNFPLHEKTIAELQQLMTSGAYSSAQITQLYLDQIHEIDQNGPQINSVIEINPDALEIAKKLDKERADGSIRGPLHGIPILIKDNIDTGDKMLTTAGSIAMMHSPADNDAACIRPLRDAGVVLLGKTNLSEWANFRSTRSSSGWSSRHGQTKNPYALDRSPSGSSSGSAAAVAANLCAVAIGTETDGSITSPAAACGLVGIKPTVGLVAQDGIIPISASQDTAGPMARTVSDAAQLLFFMTLPFSEENNIGDFQSNYFDYANYLKLDSFANSRIGIARQFFGRHPESDRQMEAAIALMDSLGADIIDPIELPPAKEWDHNEFTVLLYEFKAGLNSYLTTRNSDFPMKSLADIVEFNKQNASSSMPIFAQEQLEMAQEKGNLEEKEYLEALLSCINASRVNGLDTALEGLDAIIAPTRGPVWLIDHVNGDCATPGCATYPAVSGYPHITLPLGFTNDLPLNISFIGRPWEENRLIGLAYAFEQATHARRAPQFKSNSAIL